MRADIHDGPEHNTLQSEAGYIDARPPPPIRRNHLQRTAGPYIGSIATGGSSMSAMRLATRFRDAAKLRDGSTARSTRSRSVRSGGRDRKLKESTLRFGRDRP